MSLKNNHRPISCFYILQKKRIMTLYA